MTETQVSDITVGSSDCDALGHVNVARYFAFCNLNGIAMQTAMGFPPGEAHEGLRLSFAVVQMDSEFKAELLAGERIRVHTNIAQIGTKSATFRNWITREDGSVAFYSEWKSACLNLDTRRAHDIPDAFRNALMRFLTPAV